jgi:hypothetical protein
MKTVFLNVRTSQGVETIDEHKGFLDSFPIEYENEQGEMISEYIEHEEEQIIDSIEANDYLFFNSGEFAQTCTFTGKHPRAGETEFIFMDKSYLL